MVENTIDDLIKELVAIEKRESVGIVKKTQKQRRKEILDLILRRIDLKKSREGSK